MRSIGFKGKDVELDAHGKIKGLVGIVERKMSITKLVENDFGHMARGPCLAVLDACPSEAVRSKIVA